jgi:hypothetical protein
MVNLLFAFPYKEGSKKCEEHKTYCTVAILCNRNYLSIVDFCVLLIDCFTLLQATFFTAT